MQKTPAVLNEHDIVRESFKNKKDGKYLDAVLDLFDKYDYHPRFDFDHRQWVNLFALFESAIKNGATHVGFDYGSDTDVDDLAYNSDLEEFVYNLKDKEHYDSLFYKLENLDDSLGLRFYDDKQKKLGSFYIFMQYTGAYCDCCVFDYTDNAFCNKVSELQEKYYTKADIDDDLDHIIERYFDNHFSELSDKNLAKSCELGLQKLTFDNYPKLENCLTEYSKKLLNNEDKDFVDKVKRHLMSDYKKSLMKFTCLFTSLWKELEREFNDIEHKTYLNHKDFSLEISKSNLNQFLDYVFHNNLKGSDFSIKSDSLDHDLTFKLGPFSVYESEYINISGNCNYLRTSEDKLEHLADIYNHINSLIEEVFIKPLYNMFINKLEKKQQIDNNIEIDEENSKSR